MLKILVDLELIFKELYVSSGKNWRLHEKSKFFMQKLSKKNIELYLM